MEITFSGKRALVTGAGKGKWTMKNYIWSPVRNDLFLFFGKQGRDSEDCPGRSFPWITTLEESDSDI